jgi:hypothetical protein
MNDLCPAPKLLHFGLSGDANLECTPAGKSILKVDGRLQISGATAPKVTVSEMLQKQQLFNFKPYTFEEYVTFLAEMEAIGIEVPNRLSAPGLTPTEAREIFDRKGELAFHPQVIEMLNRSPGIIELSSIKPAVARRLILCRAYDELTRSSPQVTITKELASDLEYWKSLLLADGTMPEWHVGTWGKSSVVSFGRAQSPAAAAIRFKSVRTCWISLGGWVKKSSTPTTFKYVNRTPWLD